MKLRIAHLVLALFAVPGAALAHPHIFVEAKLEVVAGNDGLVSEIHNIWRFDEVFSSSVLLDFDENQDLELDQDELAKVGATVHESLMDFNYYTSITANGKDVLLTPPDVIHVNYQDGQLLMFFAAQPATPLPLKGVMTFGIYDPTFYTALDFVNDSDLVLLGDAFGACSNKVVRPDPDEVLAKQQQAATEAFFEDPSAGNQLAKLFATRIEVDCK